MNLKNLSYDDLSDSELFQLEKAILEIKKNFMKYLVERYFSKTMRESEWKNKDRSDVINNIVKLGFHLADIIRGDQYTEIVMDDNVGYKFDIIISKQF